jgi:hypothetical protein
MRWVGHIAQIGEKRNVYRLLVGKPEGKIPLGRVRHRWVNSIKINLGEIGWGGVDWIDLAQDRVKWKALVNVVMKLGFHKMLGNYEVAIQLVTSIGLFM